MYVPHPSHTLTHAFLRRPYQGTVPEAADVLFVGLDANYAADIERSPIFPRLLEYHEDGPTFWRQSGVHHPFLLPAYSGDGRRYHRTFAKVGFTPEDANRVSFVELLHLPTVGRNQLDPRDLDKQHLERLRGAIFGGTARHTFVSAGVLRLMRLTGAFPELRREPAPSEALRVLFQSAARTVYLHLHFSNYGKFEAQLQAESRAIAALVQRSAA
jgi:hypothetical protein